MNVDPAFIFFDSLISAFYLQYVVLILSTAAMIYGLIEKKNLAWTAVMFSSELDSWRVYQLSSPCYLLLGKVSKFQSGSASDSLQMYSRAICYTSALVQRARILPVIVSAPRHY